MHSIGIWALREEARKLWDNVTSDEVIYCAKVGKGECESSHILAEQYIDGSAWLEMHWTCEEKHQREMHFNVIVEVANIPLPNGGGRGEKQIKRIGIHRDSSMLVHRPEFIQLPKGVVPVGIPSVIRLKKVDNRCHCGWKKRESVSVVSIVNPSNREGDVSFLSLGKDALGVEVSQSPRQLIERRSQATNEISKEHGYDFRPSTNLHAEDLQSVLKICFLLDGAVFRGLEPFVDLIIKRVKVMLRPAGFHINFLQDLATRDANHAAMVGQTT
jgi:hypothetical protein